MRTLHPSGFDRRSTAGATVLIVDDSRTIKAVLRKTLEQAGYHVLEAENGRLGIETARDAAPDLMLLDVDMPVLDGHAALAEMQADPVLRFLPVLLLTARISGEEVAKGLELGARDYLRKPCEPTELTARIASTLRMVEQERALLEQRRLFAELSTHDTLTGLGNRRLLEDSFQRTLESDGPEVRVGVAIVDIDHFKAVNDTYGHTTGDVVLRVLASRLVGAVPRDAMAIRWGGEEFALAQTGADAVGIIETAKLVHAAIGESPFAVGTEHALPITVSIGVASGALVDFDDVMRRADRALYRAKNEGRNWVEVAAEPDHCG